MNQHRWTCLTTFILTAVIAPIATVRAAVPAPSATTGSKSSPLSPQLLPTITPLTVTELETDAVIPTVIQPVPLVSKLPIVAPLSSQTTQHHSSQHQKIARVGKPPTKHPVAVQPHSIFAPKANAPVFNPNNFLAIAPIVVTSESATAPVAAVVPVPSLTDRSLPAPAVASQTESTPILVVRRDRAQTTIIPNSTTAQAEIDAPSAPTDLAATAIDTPIPQPEVVPVPQVAPIVAGANNRSDTPSFEAGLPVFIFERERSSQRQIVATAIAQIGDDIVAPEPSIAIPVEPPKQPNVPVRLPVPTVPAVQPAQTQSVIIDRPTKASQPALNKIVATHTGQASWYGSEGGSRTANGESYNPSGMTAAHRTLPFGTKVRVTSLRTGKAVVVRINDRGPFHGRRMIDVSAGAAQAIGLKSDGVGAVRMEVLALGQ
jgi:rare lipoprotein A